MPEPQESVNEHNSEDIETQSSSDDDSIEFEPNDVAHHVYIDYTNNASNSRICLATATVAAISAFWGAVGGHIFWNVLDPKKDDN